MKDVLTHQDLAAVYAPEYLAEGETFDQDEEFLYEETLYENDQIDAITTYLAESYESEDIDTIFEMVEDLQSYMLEFFEFDNENEVNEAILMLDTESLVDIFEDIYEGTGIVEDTYHDITESVQFVYDSADVIEEGVLSEYFNRGKKNPNKKERTPEELAKAKENLRRRKLRVSQKSMRDENASVANSNAFDRVYGKTGDVTKASFAGAEAGRKQRRLLLQPTKMIRSHYEITQDDYDYLMEEAAILSTLKVAEMLSEADWLTNFAGTIGGAAGRAYGRHVNAMKKLNDYNEKRRKVLDKWKKDRDANSAPSTRQTVDTTPAVKSVTKQEQPKPKPEIPNFKKGKLKKSSKGFSSDPEAKKSYNQQKNIRRIMKKQPPTTKALPPVKKLKLDRQSFKNAPKTGEKTGSLLGYTASKGGVVGRSAKTGKPVSGGARDAQVKAGERQFTKLKKYTED